MLVYKYDTYLIKFYKYLYFQLNESGILLSVLRYRFNKQ